MLHVIGPPCISIKNAGCVDVCPVDCIHPAPWERDFAEHEQLHIDPEECIGCGACVAACPADAITSLNAMPPGWEGFPNRNAAYFDRYQRR